MAEAIKLHDSLVHRLVATHGGSIVRERGEGDSLFCVFPESRSAIACATDIQTLFQSVAWPTSTPIQLRIGVHKGTAQTFKNDYIGISVNICARLRGLCSPGQIVVSAETAPMAGVSCRSLGRYKLEGVEGAVEICQIIFPGCTPMRNPVGALRIPTNFPRFRNVFVGRSRELELLHKAVQSGKAVNITGKPGMGKSRLAAEFAMQLGQPIKMLSQASALFKLKKKTTVLADEIDFNALPNDVSGATVITIGAPFSEGVFQLRLRGLETPPSSNRLMVDWLKCESAKLLEQNIPAQDLQLWPFEQLVKVLSSLKGEPERILDFAENYLQDGLKAIGRLAPATLVRERPSSVGYEANDSLSNLLWMPSFSEEAAWNIARVTREELAQYVQAGRLIEDHDRYAFALLEPNVELPTSAVRYYTELIERMDTLFGAGEMSAAFAIGDAEHSTVLQLLSHLHGSDLLKLASRFRRYWAFRKLADEGIEQLSRALRGCDHTSAGVDEAQAHNALGYCYWLKGDNRRAENCYLKALSIFENIGSVVDCASLQHNLGIMASEAGNKPQAIERLQNSLAMGRTLQHDNMVFNSLLNLSRVRNDIGDFALAEANASEAIQSFPAGKVTIPLASCYYNLVTSLYHQERLAEAAKELRTAHLLSIELNDWNIFNAQVLLTIFILFRSGNLEECQRLIGYQQANIDSAVSVVSSQQREELAAIILELQLRIDEGEYKAYRRFGEQLSSPEAAKRALQALEDVIKQ